MVKIWYRNPSKSNTKKKRKSIAAKLSEMFYKTNSQVVFLPVLTLRNNKCQYRMSNTALVKH